MVDFAASRARATSLIGRAGQLGSIRRGGEDYPARFVQITAKQEDQDGQIVQRNVEMIFMAADDLTVTPRTFDLLVFADGSIRRIDSAVPFSPSGLPIFYEITLEGA